MNFSPWLQHDHLLPLTTRVHHVPKLQQLSTLRHKAYSFLQVEDYLFLCKDPREAIEGLDSKKMIVRKICCYIYIRNYKEAQAFTEIMLKRIQNDLSYSWEL